jgi:hypothetical protein
MKEGIKVGFAKSIDYKRTDGRYNCQNIYWSTEKSGQQ